MSEIAAVSAQGRITAAVSGLLSPRLKQRQLALGDDLRKSGLSSLDLVKLVLKLEQEFQVVIPETAITPQNFSTIAAIDRLISGLVIQA